MSQTLIKDLADRLRTAEETGVACAPLRDEFDADDLDMAYAIQQVNVDHGLAAGRRIVGRKIGLTSVAVQKQLGVDQPDYGVIFADMVASDAEPISMKRVMQAKAEAEVALVLGHDITCDMPSVADVIRAVDFALPAIEIVGSRIADWDIRITDTIADNASSGMVVLGDRPCKLENIDLRLCGMVMERHNEPVSVGVGAACLGSPLTAAVWLARKMAALGTPLKAGDLVMTGALGPMVQVKGGDILEARISGLGSVRACFLED